MSALDDAVARRAEALHAMTQPHDVIPEQLVVGGKVRLLSIGIAVLLQPHCLACGALRMDYPPTSIDTGEQRETYRVVTTYATPPCGLHQWSDWRIREMPHD